MKWCSSTRFFFFFFLFSFVFFFIAVSALPSSASPSISGQAFESHVFTRRNLLQAQKACPVNFEFLNYTVITSQCKGPQYPADSCCAAFKDFACPYADEINDQTNDCATTMFSYINLYGKYPPGLFASECREGEQGLACPALPPSQSEDSSGTQITRHPSLLLMVTAGFLLGLFQLF